jgi:hypothetical protein
MFKRFRYMLVTLLSCSVIFWFGWYASRKMQFSEQVVSATVFTTLQKESAQQFLVAGKLEINTTITTKANTAFNPFGLHRFVIGQTDVELIVPGEVSYGFNLSGFSQKNITYNAETETVTITLPEVTVFSAESWMERAQLHTVKKGSLQYLRDNPEKLAREAGYSRTRFALRAQAVEHLRTNDQPRTNAVLAIRKILEPAFQAAKMKIKQLRFQFETGQIQTIDLTQKGVPK